MINNDLWYNDIAEETIEIEYRKSLCDQGKIKYYCGKQEFIRRGILDGVDLAMMVHSGSAPLAVNGGCNGFVSKRMTFIGKASHGASPERGLNALYAATNALSAANAIREQYSGDRYFRFHPIITRGGEAVNVIPSEVVVESFTRGSSMNTITSANEKINRAFAASAAAMGCRLVIEDKHGSAPRKEDRNLQAAVLEVGRLLFDESDIKMNTDAWSSGCTDMGDVSTLMPVVHPFVGSGKLPGHSSEFYVEDRENGCVTNAKFQLGMIYYVMCDGAKYAKKVIDEAQVLYSSKEEYLEATGQLSFYGDAVDYREDGSILLKYK
ncbi:MAG: peptidase dimerization domain-containing protein [Clostridia bacterium]|nr:peptidase dimerization domain-containing protein [Clostridia bacterium]